MTVTLEKKTDPEPLVLDRMHAVLKQHHGHLLMSEGPFNPRVETLDASKSKGDLGWAYLGKPVSCHTCGYSLSDIWYA